VKTSNSPKALSLLQLYSTKPLSAALNPIRRPSTSCWTTARRLFTTTANASKRLERAVVKGAAKPKRVAARDVNHSKYPRTSF